MSHVHVFTTAGPGLDVCVDCPTTRRNPSTDELAVPLPECRCGRGLARFVHSDHMDCAACFGDHVQAERQGVADVA